MHFTFIFTNINNHTIIYIRYKKQKILSQFIILIYLILFSQFIILHLILFLIINIYAKKISLLYFISLASIFNLSDLQSLFSNFAPELMAYIRVTSLHNPVTSACNSKIIIIYTAAVPSISSTLMREPVTPFADSISTLSLLSMHQRNNDGTFVTIVGLSISLNGANSIKVVTLLKLPRNICACYSSESIM